VGRFQGKQFIHVLSISFAAYLQYSSHYIFGSSNEQIYAFTSWIIAAFCLFLLIFINYNLLVNIKTLRNHQRSILDIEVQNELYKKIMMYVTYSIVITIYYIFSGVCLVVYSVLKLNDREIIELESVEKVVCLAVVILVTTIFHPCFFTRSFQLSQILGVIINFQS